MNYERRGIYLSKHKYISKYAVCPYYSKNEPNRICCEGVSDENNVNLVFSDVNKLKEYSKTYCNDLRGYKECAVCKMLDQKYDD